MLSLAGREIESAVAADWKIHSEAKARREQQARRQCEIARNWLDAALSEFRCRDGEKRAPKLPSRSDINPTRHPTYRYGSCCFLLVWVRLNSLAWKIRLFAPLGSRNRCLVLKSRIMCAWNREDATDTLNPLIGAGVVESVPPYAEQVQLAEIPVTASELKSSRKLKRALIRS